MYMEIHIYICRDIYICFCNKKVLFVWHTLVSYLITYFNTRIALRHALKFWPFLKTVFLCPECIQNHSRHQFGRNKFCLRSSSEISEIFCLQFMLQFCSTSILGTSYRTECKNFSLIQFCEATFDAWPHWMERTETKCHEWCDRVLPKSELDLGFFGLISQLHTSLICKLY